MTSPSIVKVSTAVTRQGKKLSPPPLHNECLYRLDLGRMYEEIMAISSKLERIQSRQSKLRISEREII